MNILKYIVLDILYADMNRDTIFDRADYKRALTEAKTMKARVEQYIPSNWLVGYLKKWWLSQIDVDILALSLLIDFGVVLSGTLPDEEATNENLGSSPN